MLDDLLRNQLHVDGEAMTAGSLPAGLAAPTAADLVESASRLGAAVAAESEDERRNIVGLEGLDHLLGHDGGGHLSAGVGGDGVDVDVVLLALNGSGTRESKDTAFLFNNCQYLGCCKGSLVSTYGGGVVGLAKVAVDTAGGGGVDDTAVLLLEEVGPSSLGGLVGATKVDVHDGVPQAVVHVGEGLVTEDTGIVDKDIDAAEGVDGALDDGVTVLGGSLDTGSLAASLLDLVDDVVGVDEIVDNDSGTVLGKGQAVGAADASTTAGDEGDLAGEVNLLTLLAGAHLHGLLEQSQEVVGTGGVLRLGEVDDRVPVLDDGARSVGVVGLEEQTAGTLPSHLGDVATTDLVDATGLLGVALVDEGGDQGNDPVGLEVLQDIRRHDGLGHAAGS